MVGTPRAPPARVVVAATSAATRGAVRACGPVAPHRRRAAVVAVAPTCGPWARVRRRDHRARAAAVGGRRRRVWASRRNSLRIPEQSQDFGVVAQMAPGQPPRVVLRQAPSPSEAGTLHHGPGATPHAGQESRFARMQRPVPVVARARATSHRTLISWRGDPTASRRNRSGLVCTERRPPRTPPGRHRPPAEGGDPTSGSTPTTLGGASCGTAPPGNVALSPLPVTQSPGPVGPGRSG